MSEGYISGNEQTFSAKVEMEASDSIRLESALLKIEQLQALLKEKDLLLIDALELALDVQGLDRKMDGVPNYLLDEADELVKKLS